jgi:hypothetical protein
MVDLRYRVLVYLDYCLPSFGHAETVYYTPDSRVNHLSCILVWQYIMTAPYEPSHLFCMTPRHSTISHSMGLRIL